MEKYPKVRLTGTISAFIQNTLFNICPGQKIYDAFVYIHVPI